MGLGERKKSSLSGSLSSGKKLTPPILVTIKLLLPDGKGLNMQ
jgi:hypothetical protein